MTPSRPARASAGGPGDDEGIEQGHRDEAGNAMETKNHVQVQIFGHTYTIRGEADQAYILDVAGYVDRKMREITDKLPVASLSKVAILASLNIADELFKERAKHTVTSQEATHRTAHLNALLDELFQDSAPHQG
jgi:cell division protein ZapA